jgi:hypothetical protein
MSPAQYSYGYRGYFGHLRSVGCNLGKYPGPSSGDYGLASFACYTYITIPQINSPNMFGMYSGMISCMAAWFVRNNQPNNSVRQLIFGNLYFGIYADNNGFCYVRTGNTYTQITDKPILVNNAGYVPITMAWYNISSASGVVYAQVGDKNIIIQNASFGSSFTTDAAAKDLYLFCNPNDTTIPYSVYSTFNGSIDNLIYCSQINYIVGFNGSYAWFVKRGYLSSATSFLGYDDFVPLYELQKMMLSNVMTDYSNANSWLLLPDV